MRIEGDDDRRSVRSLGVIGGSRNHRLMSAMNAVEDADGEKERTMQARQFRNGVEDFHHAENSKFEIEIETNSNTKFEVRTRSQCGSNFEFRISNCFGFRFRISNCFRLRAFAKLAAEREFASRFLRAAVL